MWRLEIWLRNFMDSTRCYVTCFPSNRISPSQTRYFLQYHAPIRHYDWGLRAVKSVLVVAGHLKRAEPGFPEDQLLMRALRDFNIPKIVQQDEVVFFGTWFIHIVAQQET